jgi:Bardet-Biedl syndrome 7 protein
VPTSSNPHHIQHWLRLLPEEGCYCLSLESAVPLFTVALHATCHLQLLYVPGNVAIVSRSPPDPQAPSSTLATYRWAPETKRQHAGCHANTEGGVWILNNPPHEQQL